MRTLLVAAVLVSAACGHNSGGAKEDASAAVPDGEPCTDLSCFVVDCSTKGLPPTTLTGTVYAPNGTLALYGVDVYVPRSTPGPLPDGVECKNCAEGLLGGSIAQTRTDEAGHFELKDVPATSNVPLVIQVGKWRRQITIPNVAACQALPLGATETRLPKDSTEGDLPRIAISTGGADALECLALRLGIAPSEFSTPTGPGRVHMYANMALTPPATPPNTGRGTDQFSSTWPVDAGAMFGDSRDLWATTAKLSPYDLVLLSCEGTQHKDSKPLTALQALHDYADAGGRVFLSHWHNIWVGGANGDAAHGIPEWQSVATWAYGAAQDETTQLAIIDETVPKGMSFATWLMNVGASTTRAQLPVSEPRYTCMANDTTKSERWVYVDPALSTPAGKVSVQDLLFTTPQSKLPEERCGKVVFSDMHVSSGSLSQGGTTRAFPLGCSTGDLSPQEKALAFIFFDIASCVGTIF